MSFAVDIRKRRPPSLIGAWNFDTGSGADFSVTNNAMTLRDGATVTSRSLALDGVNDYADCNTLLPADNFTVSAWVKTTTSATVQQTIFSNYMALEDRGFLIRVMTNGKVRVDARAGTGSFIFGTETAAGVGDNVWRHVSFSRAGANGVTYVDGVSSATSSAYGTGSMQSTAGAHLGRAPALFNLFLAGNIDGVLLFNRVLTGAEVLKLYTLGRQL